MVKPIIIVLMVVTTFYMMKKRCNIGWITFVDSVFIVLLAELPFNEACKLFFSGILSARTVKLIILMYLILVMESIMRSSGMISDIITNLKQGIGSCRAVAAVLPAIIGLLPSPGGARFSCPMVEDSLADRTDNETKAFVNFWFRHVWMDSFILYPGIILAAEITGVPVIKLFLRMMVFMTIMLVSGIIFEIRKIDRVEIKRTISASKAFLNFIFNLLPIIVCVVLYIILLKFTSLALEFSVGVVVLVMFVAKKYDFKKIARTLREVFTVKYIIIIAGVMVFKEVIVGSGVLQHMYEWMNTLPVPQALFLIIVPFLGGIATGIAVGMTSMIFPLLLPLGLAGNAWYGAIAYASGMAGLMVTPMHLCMVMTSDYFNVPINRIIRRCFVAELPLLTILTLISILI